ncbi:PAS domain S-box protein [Candidatus Bathyarchaeota archaeon]|nr:PAS domain S-box protein [Candidatus Bathyarchaeota archaeon]
MKISEDRLRILFEYAPDVYYLNDLRGNFIDSNKAAQDLLGYEKEELIENSFFSLNILPKNQFLKAATLLAGNVPGRSSGPEDLHFRRDDGMQITVARATRSSLNSDVSPFSASSYGQS